MILDDLVLGVIDAVDVPRESTSRDPYRDSYLRGAHLVAVRETWPAPLQRAGLACAQTSWSIPSRSGRTLDDAHDHGQGARRPAARRTRGAGGILELAIRGDAVVRILGD
jgi:hypothetical protein